MSPSGAFVVVEGIDGAGKSAVCGGLCEVLASAGREIVPVREPGGTPEGEAIRTLLLEGTVGPFGPEAEALMFNVARKRLVDTVIRPALGRGAVVVADRFSLSTLAYQTAAGADVDVVRRQVGVARGDVSPDLTVLLDLPVDVAVERLRRAGAPPDRFEAEGRTIIESRRSAYLRFLEDEPGCRIVVDATRPVAKTVGDVLFHFGTGPPDALPRPVAGGHEPVGFDP